MKKILLFSFFILSSVAMTSCTTDSIAESTPPPHLVNADGGGQTGPTLPPKP